MQYYFGIDGGGTHGRITVLDEHNTVLYEGTGACLNIHASNEETVKQNMILLVHAMLETLSFSPNMFAAGCFGSAGLESPNEKKMFEDFFKNSLLFSCPVFLCNDSITALVGGLEKTEGFILISGTGSIASALKNNGTVVRAGGWGHVLGDEGSGYWIGMQGLARGIASAEGRDEKSLLPELIRSFYTVTSFRELFPFVYTKFDKAKIASFANIVFEGGRQGDLLCLDILDQAENSLVKLCSSVYTQVGEMPSCEIVFSGGILEHEPDFCTNIEKKLLTITPNLKRVIRRNAPAFGACLLAKQSLEN